MTSAGSGAGPHTLGISAFFHDAAAAIVGGGEIIAAGQEERFSRIKHDPSFPISAITYCLEAAGISGEQLDSVVVHEKPLRAFERMLASFQHGFPRSISGWLDSAPKWIAEKFHIHEIIARSLGLGDDRIHFLPHHLSHAAAAFYPSSFDSAAILTVDGVGEWATASIGIGEDRHVEIVKELRFPDSLGLLYSAFTYFCGFEVNSGEYKLMGLAPYGEPKYLDLIQDRIATVHEDGSIRLNTSYFDYVAGKSMISRKLEDLLGGPRREPESRITKREMDLAASIQAFTEQVVLRMAEYAKMVTGKTRLCMAGGVALNCVANGHLLRAAMFDDIWIQPAAGDAGSALGAALALQYGALGIPRKTHGPFDRQKGSLLGPAFSRNEVAAFLESREIPSIELEPEERATKVAEAIAEGRIVGFFNGRMEFGPRALGARSILGDPRDTNTQRTMNLRIKYRESFRPFAPAVLAEDADRYFDLSRPSPYMMVVAPVREELREPRDTDLPAGDDLLEAVNERRSTIPSVTHWDYSARVQTVHKETNPLFHSVLTAFKDLTGVGLVVNTSFNVRGEPIVCTIEDAYRCFMRTEMDCLYLEGFWLEKPEQPNLEEDDDWRSKIMPESITTK